MGKIPCDINGGLDYTNHGYISIDWTGEFDYTGSNKAFGASTVTAYNATFFTQSGTIPNSGADYTWATDYTKTFSSNRPGYYRVLRTCSNRGSGSANTICTANVIVDGVTVTEVTYTTKINQIYKVNSSISTTSTLRQKTDTNARPFMMHLELEYLGPALRNSTV